MNTAHASSSAQEQRISSLTGDRMCTHCGYNLIGQGVVREPHYQLLIVRCPECGAAASLQEYPLLGRWASRWAAVLAAAWFLLLMAFWLGSAGLLFGLSLGVGEVASEDYRDVLYENYSSWQAATTLPTTPMMWSPKDFDAWWQAGHADALFQQAGGWRSMFSIWTLLVLMWLTIAALALGCTWAAFLPALRTRGRLLWAMVIMCAAAAFASFPIADAYNESPTNWWDAAYRQVGVPVLIMALTWALLALMLGLWLGRRMVRGLLRLLLPPRLCSPLAILWTCDGLPAPRSV